MMTSFINVPPDGNSLAPGKFEWKFKLEIFQQISVIDGWGTSDETAIR